MLLYYLFALNIYLSFAYSYNFIYLSWVHNIMRIVKHSVLHLYYLVLQLSRCTKIRKTDFDSSTDKICYRINTDRWIQPNIKKFTIDYSTLTINIYVSKKQFFN